VRKSLAVQLAFQRFLIGGHFLRVLSEALRPRLLGTEHSGDDSRDHPARHDP
jgi:hypothetical protein